MKDLLNLLLAAIVIAGMFFIIYIVQAPPRVAGEVVDSKEYTDRIAKEDSVKKAQYAKYYAIKDSIKRVQDSRIAVDKMFTVYQKETLAQVIENNSFGNGRVENIKTKYGAFYLEKGKWYYEGTEIIKTPLTIEQFGKLCKMVDIAIITK